MIYLVLRAAPRADIFSDSRRPEGLVQTAPTQPCAFPGGGSMAFDLIVWFLAFLVILLALQIRSGSESWPSERILASVFCILMFGGALLVSSVAKVIVLASADKEHRPHDNWNFFMNTWDNLAEA
jgi:hypothetical protein